ncbi:hypothetical protein CVM73_31140 [Bradyrhizobium forestalis]|uniref:Uncharacterized protein n=1 Tax=Bradyrhizobium forestalis TaxID=1419263 RepID=A0A2M8R0R5_9BRAD|nr:hypothetical protein CVM73_31140 [Bradyrhizobium forestalis]
MLLVEHILAVEALRERLSMVRPDRHLRILVIHSHGASSDPRQEKRPKWSNDERDLFERDGMKQSGLAICPIIGD